MNRLLQLIRPPQNLFYLVSAIILIVNVFLIVNELFWLAWMLPVLLILAIFFVFSLDNVLFFIVLSTPLALIIIGATLYGFKAKEIFLNWNIQIITLFKILLFPAVFLCILYFIPIDPILKSILTILVAAPVQASSVVFAKNFKGDPLTASRCVMLSTLLCLATIPMFLMLINLHCA